MSDQRFALLCFALVLGYAALWWITSIEPPTRRQKIQRGLRPHRSSLDDAQQAMIHAADESELNEVLASLLEPALAASAAWVRENMGDVAYKKLANASHQASSYLWPGEHDPAAAERRSRILGINAARIDTIDQLLQSDAWDGPAPTLWQQARKRIAACTA